MRTLARVRIAGIGLAVLILIPFAALVMSQELEKPQANLTDGELRQFAKAYVEVEKLRESYEPRLAAASDPAEVEQIKTEAANRMKGALDKEGLTPETYNRIFAIARSDDATLEKLLRMITEEKRRS